MKQNNNEMTKEELQERIYAGRTVVATDNVPDGALENNPDGSVNAYNEAGEKVGTVTAEEAEAAEKNVEDVVVEEDGWSGDNA